MREGTAIVPGAIKNSRNGKKAVTDSLQSSLQLRVGLFGTEIEYYPEAIVALRTETEHPRARGVDILGAPTGKEGYDANTSSDWELIRSNSSACLNYP